MKKSNQGFTLIEILIALFIFAIVAVITTMGLSMVLKARERSSVQTQKMMERQLAFIIMKQDFSQMIARSVIDNTGNQAAAFLEKPHYLEFTRAGYLNPLMTSERSSLQRVAYLFTQHQLIRRTWPVLDRAPTILPSDRVLLNNLEAIKFSFLTQHNQFYLTWPPLINNQNPVQPLPKAIKIDFSFTGQGNLSLLFLIPATGNS